MVNLRGSKVLSAENSDDQLSDIPKLGRPMRLETAFDSVILAKDAVESWTSRPLCT
jgi:hypothetical protein